MVQWENGTDALTGTLFYKNYIAHIHGFILHPNSGNSAIIHSTMENIPKPIVTHRVFGNFWHLEYEGSNANHQPILQLVHVDCLLEHACMIPYCETDSFMWVHLWNPSEWPGCFQTILPPGEEGNVVTM
jgi:hypothetical protein